LKEARTMAETWSDLVWAALQDLHNRLVAVLPSILAMLTLAAVGLVAAWVAALLLRRLARAVAFDQRAETWGLVSAMGRAGLRPGRSGPGQANPGAATAPRSSP